MSEPLKNLFSKIPKNYDLINQILTFGFDNIWRKRAAKIASNLKKNYLLDVCTGTGKQAIYLKKYTKKEVLGVDFCFPMLQEAIKEQKFTVFLANAKLLPFKDETFDLLTISFATRNLNTSRVALLNTFKEFRRVLKKEGYFLNLETTQPPFFLLKFFLHLYSKIFIKPVGRAISGSKEAYAYLSSTIPKFYGAPQLKEILKEAGFSEVKFKYFFPWVVALHISKK